MTTLNDIEQRAKRYADAHAELAKSVRRLEDEIARAKRSSLPRIKRALAVTAQARGELHADIDASRHLFRRPRSHIFHGIRVGLQKSKGELRWRDAADVIQRIRRYFSKRAAAALIKTTERPLKKALAGLSAADLKRIGVTITNTSDQVLIKTTDSDIEKLVDVLLKDAEQPAEEAA